MYIKQTICNLGFVASTLSCVATGILVAIAFLLSACGKSEHMDHTDLYEEIRYEDRMEFASMAVTKTVKTERSDWYKIGKRIAVYSYDTYLKAYIDMNAFQPESMDFNEKDKTVKVTLPPIQIEIAGRDMVLKKEYENVGILRSEIDSKERAAMKEQANSDLKKELSGNPEYRQRLVDIAKRKARNYFENLLKDAGYTAFIRFEDDAPGASDVIIIE